jgi:AraC family transcriptional regulator, regulatory protein of adaptative response / DNA-3-methyladenine glycosylase II
MLPNAEVSAPTSEGDLAPDICWEAIRSRDPRFDGRFFVAAVTTGIYCRPICPVPFAKPNNIALFPCAAAAEASGFRPCRRCRPETAPGTPAWAGTSAVVSRGLRLIREGALDGGNVEDLAARLGIGSRQLRRLFIQHLGVPPVRIASTHRLHFARNLIEQTDMPMAEVAWSAGFGSIRQFNHAVRKTAGQSPRELRRLRSELTNGSASLTTSPGNGELAMRLRYRPPFHWPAMMTFLGSRATPGVEVVTANSYRRTIESDGEAGMIDVRPDPNDACLIVRIALPKYGGLLHVVDRVRQVFDLGADPLQIEAHLSRDRKLKPLLEQRPGLRLPGVWTGFEAAVRAALGQRLAVVDSNLVAGELVRQFGRPVSETDGLTHLFPRPEVLASADLKLPGITPQSAAAIQALACAVCSGELTFRACRNTEDAILQLRGIDGVDGEMANYIAMRAFGDPDAFPLELSASSVWRPWRAYAALHLWAARAGV